MTPLPPFIRPRARLGKGADCPYCSRKFYGQLRRSIAGHIQKHREERRTGDWRVWV